MTAANLPLRDFDPRRLSALLGIVGPDDRLGFLDQLAADLSTCASQIVLTSQTSDWPGLRRASHNLVALSGTCGAGALQALAQTLNAAAHRQDHAALPGLIEAARTDIAALAGHVQDLRHTGGTA